MPALSSVHRLYFNALLLHKHYDKFFILATLLVQQLEGYPFATVLNQMMNDVAFPRLNRFLKQDCLDGARKGNGHPAVYPFPLGVAHH